MTWWHHFAPIFASSCSASEILLRSSVKTPSQGLLPIFTGDHQSFSQGLSYRVLFIVQTINEASIMNGNTGTWSNDSKCKAKTQMPTSQRWSSAAAPCGSLDTSLCSFYFRTFPNLVFRSPLWGQWWSSGQWWCHESFLAPSEWGKEPWLPRSSRQKDMKNIEEI